MAFKDGEMTVVENPVAGNLYEKGGLTPQDQIDMAEIGKKQQFNVSSSHRNFSIACWCIDRMVEKLRLHLDARYAVPNLQYTLPIRLICHTRLHDHHDVHVGGCFLVRNKLFHVL